MTIVPDINVVGVIPESILTAVGLILLLSNRALRKKPNNFAIISGIGLILAIGALVFLRAERAISFRHIPSF